MASVLMLRPSLRGVAACSAASSARGVILAEQTEAAASTAYFEAACDAGSLRGCTSVGRGFLPKNKPKALAYFANACTEKYAPACVAQASITDSPRRAVRLLEKACNKRLAGACERLGDAYRDGRGIDQDLSRAHVAYRRGCEQGSVLGCERLAGLQASGCLNGARDECKGDRDLSALTEAMKRGCATGGWIQCAFVGQAERSCDNGAGIGCYRIGAHSRGCDRSFLRSCDKLAEAQLARGDDDEASLRLKRTCAQGFAQACDRRLVLCARGVIAMCR